MKQSHLLSLMAIAVLGGALWLASDLSGRSAQPVTGTGPGPEPRGIAPRALDELERPAVEHPKAPTGARLVVESEISPEVADQDPWAGQLGGLIGRVLEEDGSAVSGISVALIQADANLLLAADWAELGEPPPKLVLAEVETDEEGRFHMDGAYDASFQGLGIDLQGPRSTFRVVDTQLHHGETTDLGDIVLPSGCLLFGLVTDESGQPVPGARVRIVSMPKEEISEVFQVGIQDFRADCAVGVTSIILNGGRSPVFEPPPLVRQHLDDLPIPTTHTNIKGEYRFEGAPIGTLIMAADLPGWLGLIEKIETTAGEVELQPKILRAGKTVSGVVIDEEGEPIAGAQVMAGSEVPFGEVAILQPAGITDSEGRFSVPGCPTSESTMACARRSPDEPWVGAVASGSEELEVELAVSLSMTVHVLDLTGEPVERARIELSPQFEGEQAMMFLSRFMTLGAEPLPARFTETEPGTYVCGDITPGTYTVLARASGLATAQQTFELRSDRRELTLTCPGGNHVLLTVVDHETGEPIANARASIVSMSKFSLFTALAVGRTDAKGMVRLGPYSPPDPDQASSWGGGMKEPQILVQHPGYADTQVLFVPGAVMAEASMRHGAEISGRIVWGMDAPQDIYMLVLENREGVDGILEAFAPPRLGRSSLAGEFRFTNLQPGKYRVGVYERFLDRDPITLMIEQQEPTLVHREEDVFVEESGKTELLIDLSPSGRGQTAQLVGSVRLDGRPLEGARVVARGRGSSGRATTDANGAFATNGFVAKDGVWVRVEADIEGEDGQSQEVNIYSQSITIEPQSVHHLDLDLQTRSLRVSVISQAGGEPIADAQVTARAQGENSSGGAQNMSTDGRGEVELRVISADKYHVSAEAAGFASASTEVDLTEASFDGTVRIQLPNSTPCAGICDLTAIDYANLSYAYLHLDGGSNNEWNALDVQDIRDDGRVHFEVDGLAPGDYQAGFWINGTQAEPVPVHLPEGGDTNLLIVYQPKQE